MYSGIQKIIAAFTGLFMLGGVALAGDVPVNKNQGLKDNTISIGHVDVSKKQRRIKDLSKNELEKIIDLTRDYINSGYDAVKTGSENNLKKRKERLSEIERFTETKGIKYDLDNPYKSDIPTQFWEAGYLFIPAPSIIREHKGDISYFTGKITKFQHIIKKDINPIPLIFYDTKGFAESLEYRLKGIRVPLWTNGDSIFVNERQVGGMGREIYNRFSPYDQEGAILRLTETELFLLMDYTRIKDKSGGNEENFVRIFKEEKMKAGLSHELSHITNQSNSSAESEIKAYLSELRDCPMYITFATLSSSEREVVGETIFRYFEDKGINRRLMPDTPLETISQTAGQILQEKYDIKKNDNYFIRDSY